MLDSPVESMTVLINYRNVLINNSSLNFQAALAP